MKKIALFCSVALLALGLASCEDDPGRGIPQTNPQETVMSAGGITLAMGEALQGGDLSLAQYQNQQIPVIRLALTDEEAAAIPAGSEVQLDMELATTSDYSDAITLPVQNGGVACADWDNYFRTKLGKSPAAKVNYVRFAAYIVNAGQRVRVGDPLLYFAAKSINVTPIPMDIKIEDAYYFIGTCNGWALDNQFPFSHSDINVYDDPVFTCTVEISEEQAAGGWWWKIAPQSSVASGSWDGVLGVAVDGDSALSGSLVDTGANAGCIKEAGTFLVSINLMDMTYKFEKMSYLYTPGASNGWSQTASQLLKYNPDSKQFEGYAHLSGEFKFTSAPDWNGTNYGNAGEAGKLSTDGGAGNLSVAQDGLYYLTVDTEKLTYTATLITTYGMIGGFNSWGSSLAMTPSADFLIWKGEVTLAAGDEFKFRANDGWDINLGGEFANLVAGGANLLAPGAGTYAVTLDLSKLPYSCSLQAK